jgi:lipoprotein-releasing system permease protein
LIGILKAIGMNNLSIKNIFLFVSLKILGWGILFGNFIALAFVFVQQKFHLFKLNPEAYYIDYIPTELHFLDWALLNTGTVLTCLIFMYIPTFLISKMSPSQILRWE